jgi:hypothetical protein
VDSDPHTRWATAGSTSSAWLEVDLGKPMTIRKVAVDEPQEFQRVQAFEVQYYDGQAWRTFHKGQTLGPEWSAPVEPVTAQRFRLSILKAPGGPTICEFALF